MIAHLVLGVEIMWGNCRDFFSGLERFFHCFASVAVVIEGNLVPAVLDQRHDLNCSVLDYSGSAALEYEWRQAEGGNVLQPRRPLSNYLITAVTLADARAYECRVFESGSASPFAVGSGTLNVSSNASCTEGDRLCY